MPETIESTGMTLRRANAVLTAAVTAAEHEGVRIAAVVVDTAGHVVASQRMDGAYLTALTIAERKAFTAANFRVSTDAMRERLADISYQIQIQAVDPRLAFLPGGLPILDGDEVVGALGVSGGSGAQDVSVCRASVTALA